MGYHSADFQLSTVFVLVLILIVLILVLIVLVLIILILVVHIISSAFVHSRLCRYASLPGNSGFILRFKH